MQSNLLTHFLRIGLQTFQFDSTTLSMFYLAEFTDLYLCSETEKIVIESISMYQMKSINVCKRCTALSQRPELWIFYYFHLLYELYQSSLILHLFYPLTHSYPYPCQIHSVNYSMNSSYKLNKGIKNQLKFNVTQYLTMQKPWFVMSMTLISWFRVHKMQYFWFYCIRTSYRA